ncbi:MAG: hypothetical protein ABI763_13275 [Bacteroidota bacterium]
MRKRKNSPMWEFLQASGVLEKGSDEEIKAVKKEYRKKYFLEFKKKQRKNKPEFTLHFSNANGEYERIRQASRKHHVSIPSFIKSAAFAYLERTYLVPNRLMVAHLEKLLADCLNEIKSIANTKERFWEREQKLDRIERRIEKLETDVSELFRNPTLLTHDHQNQIT